MTLTRGIAPVIPDDTRVLILGSLPGVASVRAAQYYAHPRNAFWPIMEALFGIDRALAYEARLAALAARGVALWDVLAVAGRQGSLDSAIEPGSVELNDFAALFARAPALQLVAFNGRKAASLFERNAGPQLIAAAPRRLTLPSTSPAYAAMDFDSKLAQWQAVAAAALNPPGRGNAARRTARRLG